MADTTGVTTINGSLPEDFYNKLMDNDNLIEKWLLTRSPLPVVIVLLYFLAVAVGPRLMETRTPYQLTGVMRVYNVFQVAFNIHIIYALFLNPNVLSLIMEKSCTVDIAGEEMAGIRYAYLYYTWSFLVSKIIDLVDTVFMVLRKKNSHITFLHVYHHSAMVFFTWVTLKYAKALQGALPGLINVFVHIVMYTYYFLATFGPWAEKYLWWKQYLTTIQMTQFAVIIAYIFVLYYNDCPISKVFTYIWLFNVFVFLCLFVNFYVKSYILKQNQDEERKSQ